MLLLLEYVSENKYKDCELFRTRDSYIQLVVCIGYAHSKLNNTTLSSGGCVFNSGRLLNSAGVNNSSYTWIA